MSIETLTLAQSRIQLPTTDVRTMPPARFRVLDEAERQRAVDFLQDLIDAR